MAEAGLRRASAGVFRLDRSGRAELRFSRCSRCRLVVRRGAWNDLAAVWRREWEEAAVIGDRTVLRLFGPEANRLLDRLVERRSSFAFTPGENSKDRRTKQRLEDALLRAGFGRRCCVLGLGGGVSLDLAGFVAATFMRGVPWIALPTSLLAQVDAGLGGKTAVNTARGKNLVGAFWQPRAVLVEPAVLASLSAERWRDGLAELVKQAWIGDARLLAEVERNAERLSRPTALAAGWIRRALAVKAALVQADECEQGARAWLNFGHTVGHALEAASHFRLSHGRAVAAGMIIEARLAVRRCGLPAEAAESLARLLSRLGLWPLHLPPFARALAFLRRDKKKSGDRLRLALPEGVGRMYRRANRYTLEVEPEDLEAAWNLSSA